MSAVFRVRKSRFGSKAILQKFDDKGGKVGFHDVAFRDLGDFSLVPRAEWTLVTHRIAQADKRAQQRRDKAAKEGTPFVDSRMADDAS